MEKNASNGARRMFSLPIQTLPTFWAERILILQNFYLFDFWIPISGFPGPQISRSPNSQISRFPDFQTPPPAPPDELSDPNLTPLPSHLGIKYVASALAATYFPTKGG